MDLVRALISVGIYYIDLLLLTSLYSARMTKISILKYEGIIKKMSYERRVYESVDDSSLS